MHALQNFERNRREWTEEEDNILQNMINRYGYKWRKIAEALQYRSDDALRNRWNRLSGAVVKKTLTRYKNRVKWSKEEDAIILRKRNCEKLKWKQIAKYLTDRTPQSIRNRYTRIIKWRICS